MTSWTPTARQELENHLAGLRRSLDGSGADPEEVLDDVRRHVDEEATAAHLPVVTEADVRRWLERVAPLARSFSDLPRVARETPNRGGPDSEFPVEESREGTERTQAPQPTFGARLWTLGLAFFGVLLPAFTLGFEIWTRACAQEFFDPIPTLWHGLLVALVPLANLLLLVRPASLSRQAIRVRWWLGSAGLGVATVYALMFLPLTPFAVVGVMFGLGLLPLSPLLAVLAGVSLRRRLFRETGGVTPDCGRTGWIAFFAPWVLFAGLILPGVTTRHFAELAASAEPRKSAHGVAWLREWGNHELLLRDCYGYRRGLWDWILPERPSVETARATYFRVTGEPFNAVAPPRSARSRQNRLFFDEFDPGGAEWDAALGGEAVAGRVRGLSLVSSRLDATADADAAWAYTEWTLEFRNDHERSQREARAQLQLPPGAVVSRLTLWVNGEEREAAFAGRSAVRQAYQNVAVQQRRDPVLVTTAGPDRVLMQCFPVPPNGGTMKVRLGITAPLTLTGANPDRAALVWPRFLERNFAIPESVTHGVWLESSQSPEPPRAGGNVSVDDQGRHSLHGDWSGATLASTGTTVFLRRNPASLVAQAPDRRSAESGWVEQRIESVSSPVPARLALVLDCSRGMETEFSDIAEALRAVPPGTELALFLARDGVERVEPEARTVEAVAAVIRGLKAVGGQDVVPAIIQAWEWAAAMPGSQVLWLQGPQPILLTSVEPLRQRFERRTDAAAPRLHVLPMRTGPNRVMEKLDGLEAIASVPRLGGLADDVARFLGTFGGREPSWVAIRTRHTGAPAVAVAAPGTPSHLTRLWAAGEVQRLWRSRRVDAAIALAGTYQLVTPVSGAVVLETKAQFEQSGLKSVDPTTTPMVPEPGTPLLLALGLAVLLAGSRRHRRGCSGRPPMNCVHRRPGLR